MNSERTERMRLIVAEGADETRARILAQKLGISPETTTEEEGPALRLDADGLSLIDGELAMRGDFMRILPRLQKGRLAGEMLVKAAKRKQYGERALAIDATAGLGEDSILLAAAGFEVRMYEYDPVIAALLADALERARSIPELAEPVSRMTLCEENSIEAMRKLTVRPDVVLLDPMFPERRKSALIKKKFQLLQQLERPCSDEDELLEAALHSGAHRIIIKRPLKGPYLAEKKPDYSLNGKAIRYDCIIVP